LSLSCENPVTNFAFSNSTCTATEREHARRVAFHREHPNYWTVQEQRDYARNAVAAAIHDNAAGIQRAATESQIAEEEAMKEVHAMEDRKESFKFSNGMSETDAADAADKAATDKAAAGEKSEDAAPESTLGGFAAALSKPFSKPLSLFMNAADFRGGGGAAHADSP
jgi:hypothetical protein